MRSALHSRFKDAAERLMPVLKESGFAERGVLTPEEFVRAGDFLCRTCPTWSWEAGDPTKARPFLPRQKQFLVTRGVPSRRRAAAVEGYGGGDGVGDDGCGDAVEAGGMDGDDEGWVAPPPTAEAAAAAAEAEAEAEAEPAEEEEEEAEEQATAEKEEKAEEEKEEEEGGDSEDDDIPDLDDLEIVDEGDIDEAALPPAAVAASAAARAAKKKRAAADDDQNRNAHVVAVRTYDLSITYDKYYQVPRFWLAGFDEDRRPLGAEALLEDVAAEHARKTVTMEPHPHLSSSSPSSSSSSSSASSSIKVASIHPCRHAAVMKKLASMGAAGSGSSGGSARATTEASGSATPAEGAAGAGPATTTALDPEAYLVLFLKFIASVIPTIEYDFTMHASVGGR